MVYQVVPKYFCTDTSGEPNTFTATAFPLDFPISSVLIVVSKSHIHHSHPGEYVCCFLLSPLLSFWITLIMNLHDGLMNTYTGLFRIPDIHPFMLFGSATQVSVILCLLGNKNKCSKCSSCTYL